MQRKSLISRWKCQRAVLKIGLGALLAVVLSACNVFGPRQTPTLYLPSATQRPSATQTPSATWTPSPTARLFAPPRGTQSTPIPPPAQSLPRPEEVRVLLLVGLDQPDPFPGRADSILLLFYHPRLAKAALVSVPPDLFGYLPGWTMQRLSSAYALGGAELLRAALDYNLGVRADKYLVANSDDFAILVDELGGITVSVMETFPGACGDRIYPGEVLMDGAQALCYARLRSGTDEEARGLRQELLLRLLLERMVHGGNLARLPELYSAFGSRLKTDLALDDVRAAIPLALRLGDPARSAYFQLGQKQMQVWQISQQPPATVFLSKPAEVRKVLDQAIAFISEPSPMGEIVLTLEAELTASPTPPGPVAAPTMVEQPSPSLEPTLTATPSETPGPSPTPTVTGSLTATPSPTVTP